MRFPSCIGTMILRSMMATDSSCFSTAFRLATTSGSAAVRGCAQRVAVVKTSARKVLMTFDGSTGLRRTGLQTCSFVAQTLVSAAPRLVSGLGTKLKFLVSLDDTRLVGTDSVSLATVPA